VGLEKNRKLATELAIQNAKLNRGLKTLGENWKDWSKQLKDPDLKDPNYVKALTGARDALSDLINIEKAASESLSPDWFKDNANIIE
jgi:hypothetical protein